MVSREYAIKAGVLAVLAKCVTWPADTAPTSSAPLIIGILGKDRFAESGVNQLDRMVEEERERAGYSIVVKRFASVKDYQPCHILFVSDHAADARETKSVAERIETVKRMVDGAAVLIVGESDGLAQHGTSPT